MTAARPAIYDYEIKDKIRWLWNLGQRSMIEWMVKEKGFNPKHAPRAWKNFVESMVFAKLPPPGWEKMLRDYCGEFERAEG